MAHLGIFVYGTLKPGGQYHQRYCQGDLQRERGFQGPFPSPLVQAAMVPGRLYHLPQGYPALTDGEGWVMGVLLRWQGAGAVLQRLLADLDDLEDYDPQTAAVGQGAGNLYDRQWRGVYHPDGRFWSYGWVYVMGRDRAQALGGRWLPGGSWPETLDQPHGGVYNAPNPNVIP
ncbi:gamma-glutamylcyclotransferase family protein [Prochlorothrix hollandica]|uniref:gamma-glutamylcyclotransferase family protein n=1 Tax=Prochlorothrix hollandica TaxID=1223 RepID=UPI0003491BCF|nr:gamma-glutamylcyclotransferase [Prochlorothrix hollandica]